MFFHYWHQSIIMLPFENTDTSFSWDYQLMSAAERKWKCKEMEGNNLCVQLCTQIQRPAAESRRIASVWKNYRSGSLKLSK